MDSSLIPFAIFNIVINSLLAFFTAFLFIELLLKIFRIQNPRYKSLLKMIPVVKMPLDLVWISWSTWALAHQIYPWECPKGSRILTISLGYIKSLRIGFFVSDGFSFSVADILGYLMGGVFLKGIVVLLVGMTFYRCLSFRKRPVLSGCIPKMRPIQNTDLREELQKQKVALYTQREWTGSPFITGNRIVFPENLELSQNEYEAVIAHELEHYKRKDPLVRALMASIQTVFWWIPMGRVIRSVEENQEMACDLASTKYQSPVSLASALLKVAKGDTCYGIPFVRKSQVKKRIQKILNNPPKRRIFSGIVTAFFGLAILFGKLWNL